MIFMVVLDFGSMIPFFFVLALVYGSMEVAEVFKNRGVKVVISVAVAFFAVSSPQVVELINWVMPYAAIFFIAFFLLGFVMSFFKGKGGESKDYIPILVILALVLVFLGSQEGLGFLSLDDPNFLGMIVLLVIVLILYAAYKSGNN